MREIVAFPADAAYPNMCLHMLHILPYISWLMPDVLAHSRICWIAYNIWTYARYPDVFLHMLDILKCLISYHILGITHMWHLPWLSSRDPFGSPAWIFSPKGLSEKHWGILTHIDASGFSNELQTDLRKWLGEFFCSDFWLLDACAVSATFFLLGNDFKCAWGNCAC